MAQNIKQLKKKYIQIGRNQVEEGLPGWFGTFADMMTLLFAFFVLLAAISTIDPVKLQEMADAMGKSVGKKIKKESQAMNLAEIKKALEKTVKDMSVDPKSGEKPVEISTNPKGVTISISSDVSFPSGSAELKQAIIPILESFIPTIKSSYFMVAIEGHTDSDPLPEKFQRKYPSNWELSGARAAAVVRELVRLGVKPTRLQSVGYAEFVPRDRPTDRVITSDLIWKFNSTIEQKSRNRRVEITFLAPAGGRTSSSTGKSAQTRSKAKKN